MAWIVTDYDPSVLADLKPAVARLRIPQYGLEGTGFLVSADQILTCRHVVKDLDVGGEVECRFGEGAVERTAKVERFDEAGDAALLSLETPVDGVRPLELAPAGQPFTSWIGYGFPAFSEGVGVPLVGHLLDPVVRDRDGRAAVQLDAQMLVGESVSLGGFSGTPVLAGRKVVGMLYRVLGAKGDWSATHFGLLYAVPGNVLAALIAGEATPTVAATLVADDESRHSELACMLGELRAAGNAREVHRALSRIAGAGLLRPGITLQAAEMLLDMGAASDVLRLLPDSTTNERSAQLRALAYSLCGEHQRAIGVLSRLAPSAETGGITGGVLKRRYLETRNSSWLKAAHAEYHGAYTSTRDPYPGINAAALALWTGDRTLSRALAEEVRAIVAGRPEAQRVYWDWATLGEAHLLLGDVDASVSCYERAVAMIPAGTRAIATMRTDARINLEQLGRPRNELDEILSVGAVACVTGHRVDAAGAPRRFPTENVPLVVRALKREIDSRRIQFGFGSAASGADILFMEALLDAGGEPTIYLPFPVVDFVATSVGPEWRRRFDDVLERVPSSHHVTVNEETPKTGDAQNHAYARCNDVMQRGAVDLARMLGERPVLIAVAAPGGTVAAGGTREAIQLWAERNRGEVVEIDPLHPDGQPR